MENKSVIGEELSVTAPTGGRFAIAEGNYGEQISDSKPSQGGYEVTWKPLSRCYSIRRQRGSAREADGAVYRGFTAGAFAGGGCGGERRRFRTLVALCMSSLTSRAGAVSSFSSS